MFEYIGIAPDRSLSSEIGRCVGQVEIIVDVVGHLVRNVNAWVLFVKIIVKTTQVELVLSVRHFLDWVSIFILRILLIKVLLTLFLFLFIPFLHKIKNKGKFESLAKSVTEID